MEGRLMDTLEARGADTLRQDYLARARELRPILAAGGDEAERRREVTPEVVEALIERGIFKMLLPKSIGGAELDPLTYTAVLEELARGDGSTAWCLGQNSGCSMIAPYLAPEIAREIFGGPHGILAWGPDLPGAGRTVAVEGGYRLTGRWGFATGSRHATWLGCHVPVVEPDGSPRLLSRRDRRDVGGSPARQPHQPRPASATAASRDLGDPPGARCRRDGLSRRRGGRDFRGEPARTADARHPCRNPAGAGPRGAFRDGRPDADGPAAGRPDVPVEGFTTAQ